MYGLFTYIWVVLGVNVGKYTIHWHLGYLEPEMTSIFEGQPTLQNKAQTSKQNKGPKCGF